MIALVLQARIDSSRLPEKSMLSISGRPMIFRVMEALRAVPCGERILACPEDSVSAFAPLAEEAGFTLIPGPKDDVLSRYCNAIRQCGPERVIRATGDNPFVFVDAAVAINQEAMALVADYAAYAGLPHGAGVESVASETLLRAEREARTPAEREHVCPYIYTHPELFYLHRPLAPPRWQGLDYSITIDTQKDYDRAQILYEHLLPVEPKERNRGENVLGVYRRLFARDRHTNVPKEIPPPNLFDVV